MRLIAVLASVYVAVAAGQSLTKMASNIYRSWVAEAAVLDLRQMISRSAHPDGTAEVDAIGAIVVSPT